MGEMGIYFHNPSLLFNKLPLLFNTRALLANKSFEPALKNIPAMGIKSSQCGNKMFPCWECVH